MCNIFFLEPKHPCRAYKIRFIFFELYFNYYAFSNSSKKYGLNIFVQKSCSNRTCNLTKLQIWDSRKHQNLFHEFWSYGSQDIDFRTFKPFFGNYFSEAKCTRCSAPTVADERTRLPAGPAGQSAERGELRRAGAHRRRPLSANQAALRVLRLKANSAHPFARPEKDRSKLTTGHAGAAALLTVVPRRWPGRARLEWLVSIAVPRRARRAN